MNERERVLDLVKKGVLSTEEALDLLEGLAKEKGEKHIQKANEEVIADKKDFVDSLLEDPEEKDFTQDIQDQKTADKKNLDAILDDLATEANRTSVELDELNVEITGLDSQLIDTQSKLMELNTKEELDILSEEELAQRQALEAELKALELSKEDLENEKADLETQLKGLKKDQWTQMKDDFRSKFNDDWKDQASDALNQAGEKMAEAGSQIGRLLKHTFSAVSQTVNDNVEWKDINVKVPGVSNTKFDHSFEFDASDATILDVKVANGNVDFAIWEEDFVKVDAKITLYGKMEGSTPLDAFNERSRMEVDDDHILFHVPNKRVRADLVFYLPNRMYDHVAVKLLNGNVQMKDLEAKDVYTQSTNGNMDFKDLTATMLEINGVNGNITLAGGEIMDTIIENVNGNITVKTTPQTIGASLVNGDIRLTFAGTNLKKIDASSVNGTVKAALSPNLGLEGTAKTSLGKINSRMSNYEVVREKKAKMNQLLQFRRQAEDSWAQIELSTTTGNILLKDTDQ
ncbi:daptomycin-sensing surface protein LiaX [Enterococcus sp. 2201sp1_2201st1_B8_2201SCRN_220225]|uniref:daptomycin-sensing surface protein LiaX n=1 Tax=unclassified Enterococcus TaxID=2608891 RepID=UPI0034A1D24F